MSLRLVDQNHLSLDSSSHPASPVRFATYPLRTSDQSVNHNFPIPASSSTPDLLQTVFAFCLFKRSSYPQSLRSHFPQRTPGQFLAITTRASIAPLHRECSTSGHTRHRLGYRGGNYFRYSRLPSSARALWIWNRKCLSQTFRSLSLPRTSHPSSRFETLNQSGLGQREALVRRARLGDRGGYVRRAIDPEAKRG